MHAENGYSLIRRIRLLELGRERLACHRAECVGAGAEDRLKAIAFRLSESSGKTYQPVESLELLATVSSLVHHLTTPLLTGV